ncbi:hypothetical protein [Candidatus Thiodictyon syntrophicum]|jgi:hypothetical protein|nr:hypothetical protein [Candidatus Thiodictyon syntrophicum]
MDISGAATGKSLDLRFLDEPPLAGAMIKTCDGGQAGRLPVTTT